MMEEQDLRRIPETAYLNAEHAARYRAILRFCYRRHEHMQTFVYPEEIFRELAQTSFFAAYTEEQLAQDLAQLEAWGNLTAQQEVARAHNIAEFKRKRFRYQCTPYTVEIERMVERLRGLGDSFGGSLETTQFDRLLSHLSSLLLDAAGQSDEQLLQTWEDLLHYFRTLVENASDYLAHLRSAKVEERMQTSAFLAYKDMFTQYLRSFVLGLQRAAQQVSALLEQAEDFGSAVHDLIKETIRKHERILFNGNGYGEEWVEEATKVRGLSNLKTTADAMPHLLDRKNMDMLMSHKVFTETELHSRCEIMLENYCKTVNIEGHTMVDMVRKNYLPSIEEYLYSLARTTSMMKSVSDRVKCNYEVSTMERLSELTDYILERVKDLEKALEDLKGMEDIMKTSGRIRDDVIPKMEHLRKHVDEAEMLMPEKCWPFPSYGKLLFSVY